MQEPELSSPISRGFRLGGLVDSAGGLIAGLVALVPDIELKIRLVLQRGRPIQVNFARILASNANIYSLPCFSSSAAVLGDPELEVTTDPRGSWRPGAKLVVRPGRRSLQRKPARGSGVRGSCKRTSAPTRKLQWRSAPQGSCSELASDGSRLERLAKCPHGVDGAACGCRTHHLRLSAGMAAEEFAEILQPWRRVTTGAG